MDITTTTIIIVIHHHHHEEETDRGDIYEVELAELSCQFNIESEEKERTEGNFGFLA